MQPNSAIAFICICVRGNQHVYPTWKTGAELVRLAHFFEMVLRTHPDFRFFQTPYIDLNGVLNRQHAHYKIQLFYEDEFIVWASQRTASYAATVLYFESAVSDAMKIALSKYDGSLVVICHSVDHAELAGQNLVPVARDGDLLWLRVEDALHRLVWVYGSEPLPFLPTVGDWPSSAQLRARTSAVMMLSHKSALRANEYLVAQRLRARVAAETNTDDDGDDAEVLGADRFLKQSYVDEVLFRCKHRMPALSAASESVGNQLIESNNLRYHEELLLLAEASLPINRGELIIYVPCVNRKEVNKDPNLKRQSGRVKSVIFAKWNSSGPILRVGQGPRGEDEQCLARKYEELLRAEQNVFHQFAGFLALSLQVPAICLSNLSARLFGEVSEITSRFQTKSWQSANEKLVAFGELLAGEIPQSVLGYIKTRPAAVTFLSDLPMEWLRIDGVPITSWCRVSRFPITPGDALFNQVRTGLGQIFLTTEKAQRVLVVNCLAPDDRLFRFPRVFSQSLEDSSISHRYVEVGDLLGYRHEIESFSPAILIHIGHGTFDTAQQLGKIRIGSNEYDLSRHEMEWWIPPIVLLAACSTWAANPYRATGLGFLRLGARSVLAAMMDLQADRTLYLFQAILTILRAYLAKRMRARPITTWGLVVSHALTLASRIDIIFDFDESQKRRGREGCPRDVMQKTLAKLDEVIAALPRATDGKVDLTSEMETRAISEVLLDVGVNLQKEFLSFAATNQRSSHSVYFTHLGLPESIVIKPDL